MRKGHDKLTVSVDKKTKDSFKQLCDQEGLKIGKQVELFMRREIAKREKVNNEKE